MKFKVGDRVKVIKVNNHFKASHVGRVTTIKAVNPNGDRHVDIHGEHYTIVGGSPFVFYTNELAAATDKIVITTDGKETLARLYEGDKVIKSATAKCSPDDTFDFQTGARIAFDRLFAEEKKEEKPKFEVGETVKVVNSGKNYRIYDEWFTKKAPELAARYVYNNDGIPDGTRGVVKKIAPHLNFRKMLYAIEFEKGIYLISEDGIERA